MALGVNQLYKNYYTVRLNSLTSEHEIQSNRITLYTNQVTDIASKINFFEDQKVLTLATPDNQKLAIGAKYFDLPNGFDASDSSTWSTIVNPNGSAKDADHPYYTTPCQKQLFIYKKLDTSTPAGQQEADNYKSTDSNDYYYAGNLYKDTSGQVWTKIPYTGPEDSAGNKTYDGGASATGAHSSTVSADAAAITDSRILSNRLMTGQFTFIYTDDNGAKQKVGYNDLTFITESQDQTAYQETVQNLETERDRINKMQKSVQQEMSTTETQIQAIQTMMDSTDKVLQKNTDTFKWGA